MHERRAELFRAYRERPGRDSLLDLLKAWQDPVYTVCLHVLRNPADAEDASQDALLKILDGVNDIRDPAHFRPWVHRVALTTSVDHVRRRARRADREREAAMSPIPSGPSPETADAIHEHLASLRDDLRSVLVEHYFERRTLDEIGRALGCSSVAVWKKVQKATDELRRRLAGAGIPVAAPSLLLLLDSVRPGKAPAGVISASVAARAEAVSASAVPASIAIGGIAVSMQAKAAAVVVSAILAASLVGVASNARPPAVIERPAQPAAEPRHAEDVQALEVEYRALETRKAALLAARPAPTPPPPVGIDWKMLFAAMDWKRLLELWQNHRQTPEEEDETNDLFRASIEAGDRAAARESGRFPYASLLRSLAFLNAFADRHPALKGPIERAMVAVDRMVAEPRAMSLEQFLAAMELEKALGEEVRALPIAENALPTLKEPLEGGSMFMLNADTPEQAIQAAADFWNRKLGLIDARPVTDIAARYVRAWLENPRNAAKLKKDYPGDSGDSYESLAAAVNLQIAMQRELLQLAPTDEARARILKNDGRLEFHHSR